MRKGITPVIAVVLLIAVSVGGSVAVYEVFQATQSTAKQYQPDLGLSQGALSIESCWGSPTDFNLSVRNEGSKTVNASRIPVQINLTRLQQPQNYTISNPMVDPRETFTLDIQTSQPIDQYTNIKLLTKSEVVRYQCLYLD